MVAYLDSKYFLNKNECEGESKRSSQCFGFKERFKCEEGSSSRLT